MEVITLPTAPIKAAVKNPKNLIIFSKPKVGKTTLLSMLPNCLILDFEDGSDYVDALKVKIIGINLPAKEDPAVRDERHKQNRFYLTEIGKAIKDAGKPYDFVAVDTATALEDMCITYAESLYSKSPMGKYWFTGKDGQLPPKQQYGNILNLPEGAGYKWLRDAYEKSIKFIQSLADQVIIAGHVKDIQLDKNGSEFTSSDLDLTGKIKRISASYSDAIGYLFRRGNKTILSFKSSDEIACGARPAHLKGKEIILAEENEGEIETFWERIYVE